MKILVVDDHPLVRRGIASTLSFENDIEEVLEASNIGDAVKIIKIQKPDLAIVDLYLGHEDGLEVVSKAK